VFLRRRNALHLVTTLDRANDSGVIRGRYSEELAGDEYVRFRYSLPAEDWF